MTAIEEPVQRLAAIAAKKVASRRRGRARIRALRLSAIVLPAQPHLDCFRAVRSAVLMTVRVSYGLRVILSSRRA